MKFKDIPGFRGYAVSKCGEIYSYKTNKILKKHISNVGYYVVTLSINGKAKTCTVHRLLMLAYKGKSNKTVNHKDFNKLNNNIDNLEYVSMRKNIDHARKHKRYPREKRLGERNNNVRLTAREVYLIRKNLNKTNKKLSEEFNVSPNTIRRIRLGITWSHLK